MIKPPYVNRVGQNVLFDIVAHKGQDQDKVHTCKYLWQSVTARENSPDQVFRGELAMSSRILDIGKMCAAYQNLLPTTKPPTHPCVLTFAHHQPASFFEMATPSIRQLTPPIGFTKTLQQQMTNKYGAKLSAFKDLAPH